MVGQVVSDDWTASPTLRGLCAHLRLSWLVGKGFTTSNSDYMKLPYNLADDDDISRPAVEKEICVALEHVTATFMVDGDVLVVGWGR